jgi:hypothetical protein
MSSKSSHDAWSESTLAKTVRRIRTYSSPTGIAYAIRDKWGMKSPKYGATYPLAYAVNPNPSRWHAKINEMTNFDLRQVSMKTALMDPTRRFEITRAALRQLQPRSKMALEARLGRAYGEGIDPIALVSELAGQPEGLARLYGALTWNGHSHQAASSDWGRSEAGPGTVETITGHMLDDFLISNLQTTLIAALLRA